jgi:hypothetical protein
MRNALFCKCLSGVGLAVLFAGATGANAAMVTYTVDAAATIIPATTTSVSGVDYTDTSTFPQFNPALGTLTDASFSYNYGAAIDVEGGGGAVGQISGELFANGVDTGIGATGGGFGPGGVSALSGSFTGTYDDPNLTNDTGTGSATFAWDTTGDYITIAFGTPTVTLESTSPSPVSLTYTYTPAAVPEPASISVLATGGLVLLGRRRRQIA